MILLRSLVFNVLFYSWTAVYATALVLLVPFPRRVLMSAIMVYLRSLAGLERHVLGLTYEVRGREHVPPAPFILAGKHQSLWETMKLHLLIDDPAIVLKRELLWIPIWGWIAARTRQIPVRRGARGVAMMSMLEGARRRVAEGRPLAIFPQGTRVAVGRQRPYKKGVAILYSELGVPLVPMALNSGLFWPRRKFIKRPGKITVEFLPPIPPGLDRELALAELERRIEQASDRLAEEAGGPRAGQVPADRPSLIAETRTA